MRSDLQLSSGLMEWAEGQVPGSCFCVFERCRRVWSDQLSKLQPHDATGAASSVVPLRRRRRRLHTHHVGAIQEGLTRGRQSRRVGAKGRTLYVN